MFWSNIIIAGSTVVLAIITLFYLLETREMRKTTQEMLRVSDKPHILIYLFPDETYPHCINLCIQNIGTGFAHKIDFTGDFSFTPMLPRGWKPLADNGIIKNGIDYLGPGKKIEIFLFMSPMMRQDSMVPNRPPILEERLDITVTYQDSMKKERKEEFLLEFKQWEDYGNSESQPIAEIADFLKTQVADTLDEIKRYLQYKEKQ